MVMPAMPTLLDGNDDRCGRRGRVTSIHGGTYIEAENYTALVNGTNGEFTTASSEAGYNGSGYIYTTNSNGQSGQEAQYTIDFPTTGTYYVWIRSWSADTGSDSIFFAYDGVLAPAGAHFNLEDSIGWNWDDQSCDQLHRGHGRSAYVEPVGPRG